MAYNRGRANGPCGKTMLGDRRNLGRQLELTMSNGVPQSMEPFVQRMVDGRRYLNEQEVVTEGLRLLEARETLREEVAKGFASLDAGKGVPAEQVYSRAEKRIADVERGER